MRRALGMMMHNAHLTVMKRIEPKVLRDLELLREAVRRIDAEEAEFDGFGTRVYRTIVGEWDEAKE
jgi:hypothetical protein